MTSLCNEKAVFTIQLDGIAKTPVLNDRLSKDGGNNIDGPINMSSNKITNISDPISAQGIATKNYVDTATQIKLSKSDDLMLGALGMSSNKITSLGDPISLQDCVTKTYVDTFAIPSFITITDIMPNTPNAEIYLYPSGITINNGKFVRR